MAATTTAPAPTPPRPAVLAPSPAFIPAELRAAEAWIGWRLEPRKGRWTKVPIDLRTGELAKSDDPGTWCSFDTALREYRRHNCDGIGLCRTSNLLFIDLDGCLDSTGQLLPFFWALETLHALTRRAYIERSVSGTGLHAILRCASLPGTRVQFEEPDQKHCGVAFYAKARYFTMSGAAWGKQPETFADETEVVDAL